MSERSTVQNPTIKYAKSLGWRHRRFEIETGDPDDAFFKDGKMVLIEFKAKDEAPKKHQLEKHKEWRADGFMVHIVDDKDFGKRLFDALSSDKAKKC